MKTTHATWTLIFLLLSGGSVIAQERGKKYALVVGIERYDPNFFNRLRFAEDDALESDLFRSTSTDLGTVGLTPRTVPIDFVSG